MTYEELKRAVEQSEEIMRQSQSFAKQGLRISAGRLRLMYVDQDILRALKRELRQFNANTGKWSDQ